MPIDFYYFAASSICRPIVMTAEAIGVELNPIELDSTKAEHRAPEFVKLNPQHCCPTINDNGNVVWESRAILMYLAEKYDKTGTFYPKNVDTRAVIHRQMFYDMELVGRFAAYYYPQVMGGAPADPQLLQRIVEHLEFLDISLERKTYVAGDNITVADTALIATLTTIEALNKVDFSQFKNIPQYIAKCKATVPGYNNPLTIKMRNAFIARASQLK